MPRCRRGVVSCARQEDGVVTVSFGRRIETREFFGQIYCSRYEKTRGCHTPYVFILPHNNGVGLNIAAIHSHC